ncbi:hypothetical protein POJ06DRAFT_246291 [Lipomyces tetrasporus]|uniref:DASH complex subunit SPC34 n=1 Tax=Lipomyces tetrasporus TaxID=54092 RepID=A0AAD7QWX4_9ASCO|nr:uncharacterized protein POJ06DRAFT_246291 [Lipomyces tetrasporus]KAJ8103003.1 hypothetical protein POJ06DRAFT_246291 [Lipomyces tetrasporus]
MANLDSIIYSLAESAGSLSTLDFSRDENFTNAVLQRVHVTSLIRDVDNEERQVLMIDRKDKRIMLRNSANLAESRMVAKEKGGVTPLKTRIEEGSEMDIDEICEDLERLVKIYPSAVEIVDRINYFKERGRALKESVDTYEQLVDERKALLNTLHLTTNDPYGTAGTGRSNAVITSSMLQSEQREVEQLEARIAEKQNDLKHLEQELRNER